VPDEPNPYTPPLGKEAPVAAPEGEPDEQFAVRIGTGTGTLSFYPGVLYLQPDDGVPGRTLERHAFVEQAALASLWGGPVNLVARQPRPVLLVQLRPDARRALREWLSPVLPAMIAAELRAQRWMAVLMGLACAAVGSRRPLDVAYGIAWLIWALAVTFRPHRGLYLALSLLWGMNAVFAAAGALHRSSLFVVAAALFALWALGPIRKFFFMGPPSP
jgi:hypothetical protein